jgi:hypothetical protein
MNKPTREQIIAEVKLLKQARPKLRRFSAFGDDHYAEIDAQIEVLESAVGGLPMDEDDVYDQNWYENVQSCALEAALWLVGESEDASLLDGWKGLVHDE